MEVDGGEDDADLLRFASHTRLPPGLRRLYCCVARRTFVPFAPTIEEVATDCATAGLSEIHGRRLEGLPFLVVSGTRRQAAP